MTSSCRHRTASFTKNHKTVPIGARCNRLKRLYSTRVPHCAVMIGVRGKLLLLNRTSSTESQYPMPIVDTHNFKDCGLSPPTRPTYSCCSSMIANTFVIKYGKYTRPCLQKKIAQYRSPLPAATHTRFPWSIFFFTRETSFDGKLLSNNCPKHCAFKQRVAS